MKSIKRKRTSEQKKLMIIEKTKNLLLRKGGSSAVSTSDICASAHLTRSSLYHHFGSKMQLILSVHHHNIEETLTPYMEEAARIKDPYERFTFMIRTFTSETVCQYPELRVLLHDQLVIKDKHFREIKAEWKRHYFLLRDTIAELQSKGVLSMDIKASWAALLVLGMLTWMTFWFDYERKDEIPDLSDAVLRMVLRGLAANSNPASDRLSDRAVQGRS